VADLAAERRALVESIAASVLLGGGAIAWGVAAQSRVLLFDGVFLLLGVVLAGLSLMASRAATAEPTARFPFGRPAVTPLAIAVQGAALLGTLAFAAADAVAIITAGGSDVAPVTVAAYGVVSMVAAFAVARWLRHRAPDSDLVGAEVAQWHAGALLSAVFAVGAGLALLLSRTSFDGLVHYVDPILVLVACALLLPIPIRLLRAAGVELMEGAAPPHVQEVIARAVADVRSEFGLDEPAVRSTKLGGRLYVEVDFVVAPGQWDVSDEDRVRRTVIAHLEPLGYDLWAHVELTTDPELAL
jgi:predicted Co/Zn/Cd cation transporter (cation efflux family)